MTAKTNKGSIQFRIVATTVSALFVMCLLVALVSYTVFNRYLTKSLIKSSEASLMILSDSINTDISSIYHLSRFCQTNSAVSTYIKESPNPDSVTSVSTYDRLYEEYVNNPASSYIPRLAIITNDHFLQIVNAMYSADRNLAKEIPCLPFYKELLDSKDYNFSTGFIKDPFYRNGIPVLPIIRPITHRFNDVLGGYLFMEINENLFTEAFSKFSVSLMEDSMLYLTVGNHFYIYNENTLSEIASLPENIVTAPLDFPDCYISQSISSSELNEELKLFVVVMAGVIAGIITIGITMVIMLNSMISKPVTKLQAKMNKVSTGDFKRDPSIEWDHELGDIGRGINDLGDSINELMETRLLDEKQKRDLEYQVLLNQINPHFLYNTLNSIKWMATVQGADGISEMTTALAKLLKSIAKGTASIVSIEEELSLLKDYFTIQSYRYGGTISLNIDLCDDEITKYGIIKFTLQPIVENAIFHGIEPKGHGNIDVSVKYEKSGIVILVHDDGIGMSPEMVETLLTHDSHEKNDFFKELGIKNVHNRLQYEFGEEYGLQIESREGEYTNMYIHIPKAEI